MTPATDDQLSVSSDRKTVGYLANEAGNVSLTLTSEAVPDASYGYNVDNISLSAGQGITVTNDTSTEMLALSNKKRINQRSTTFPGGLPCYWTFPELNSWGRFGDWKESNQRNGD